MYNTAGTIHLLPPKCLGAVTADYEFETSMECMEKSCLRKTIILSI